MNESIFSVLNLLLVVAVTNVNCAKGRFHVRSEFSEEFKISFHNFRKT